MKRLCYTGVGSRQTPTSVLRKMTVFAARLKELGFVLRSGGCEGADEAFERGVGEDQKQIFLPWPGFNPVLRRALGDKNTIARPAPAALTIAASIHPAWDRCSSAAMILHSRNVHQVLGPDLQTPEPSAFCICWTPDGASAASECTINTGGTGTAIRLCDKYGVPVFNLQKGAAVIERLAATIKAFVASMDQ